MMTIDTLGKAIWRPPGKHIISYLTNSEGDDEFIIAPFNKNEPPLCIRGKIRETNPILTVDFFDTFLLNKATKRVSTTRPYYIENIDEALVAINKNEFEKVVLARQYIIQKQIDIHQLFISLEVQYPQAFVYCFILDNGLCMIGATPETLLEKNGESLTTEALGGTKQGYGYSEKEYKEHDQIIIDISVKLEVMEYEYHASATEAKTAGNVAHLSTLFNVKSKSTAEDLSLLQALHPTAAICGLPNQEANSFLLAHEDFNRHYYAGYLGTKQKNNFNFYVNLRCAEIEEGQAILFAGAGINKDSIAENEWEETTLKLDTLLRWV